MFTPIEHPSITHITSSAPTDHQLAMHQARMALEVAENRLNIAEDDDSRDAASHEVTAARIRLNAVFKRAKTQVVENGTGSEERLRMESGVWKYLMPKRAKAGMV